MLLSKANYVHDFIRSSVVYIIGHLFLKCTLGLKLYPVDRQMK